MSKNGAATRKENSISRLQDHSVPYIGHLPETNSEEDSLRLSKEEVGLRIICLALVSMKGAGAADQFVHAGKAKTYTIKSGRKCCYGTALCVELVNDACSG